MKIKALNVTPLPVSTALEDGLPKVTKDLLEKKKKSDESSESMDVMQSSAEVSSGLSGVVAENTATDVMTDAMPSASEATVTTTTTTTTVSTSGISTLSVIGTGLVIGGAIAAAGGSGGSGGGSSTTPTVAPKTALAIQDGPIKNAAVYIDSDGDGKITANDEKVGTTDANGTVQVDSNKLAGQSILATGGTDVTTGLKFDGVLKAPAGSKMVNPLTTLVQSIVEQNPNVSVADAQSQVKTALGLSSSVDLTTFNPATSTDTTAALAVQKAAVQVITVMNQLADALGGDAIDMSAVVANAIASMIASSTGVVDLANTATLNSIATSSATSAGVTGFDASNVVSTLSTDIASVKAATDITDLTNTQIEVNSPTEAPTSAPTSAPTEAPYFPPYIPPTPPADTTPPSLTITSSKASLKTGETATITFGFSEVPSGFSVGDVVVVGGTLSDFAVSETNTKVYTAVFTPTPNTAVAASITVAAGAYSDASRNAGGEGVTPNISIDTLAPSLAITSNVNAVKAGETATITFTFSETPTGFTADDVVVTGGTLTGLTVDSTDNKIYTATFTPTADTVSGNASITVGSATYTDVVGNEGGAGITPSISIDTLAPTANLTAVTDDSTGGTTGALTSGSTSNDSELVLSGTCEAGSTVNVYNGATLLGAATVSGTGWTYNATVADATTYQFNVKETDSAGNSSSATSNFTVIGDMTAPTASVQSATLASSGHATVQSSETGTAYIVNDTVTVTNLSSITGAADNTYNSVSITNVNTDTQLALTGLVDGSYKVYTVDAAGNLSSSSSNSVTLDTTGASVSSVAITGATGVVNGYLNAGDVVTATVTMDDTVVVTGSPTLTLIVNSAEVTATYNSANSTATALKFDYTIQSGETDANGISIKADSLTAGTSIKDTTGNDATLTFNSVADNASYMVDTTVPTANLAAVTDDSTGGTTGALTSGATSNDATLVLSGACEAGSTVNVYNGTTLLGEATVSGTGWTYNATVVDATTYTFNVKETDAAGNTSAATSNFTVIGDMTVPTTTITDDQTATASDADNTILYTFDFSEDITGFTTDDVTVTGGTKGTFVAVDANTYTLMVTADDNSTTNVGVTLGTTDVIDAAGNAFAGASDNAQVVDTVNPTLEPITNTLSYGASEFFAQTSTDGTKIIISSSEAMALGTATASSFTINGSSVTVSSIEVDGSDSTKVNLILSTSLVRDITPITLTYSGGLTDVAGNAFESFSTQAVQNKVANASPIAATITASKFVQLDASADKNYIELTGTDFFKFIDKANGAGTDTDIKDQFDWTKFVWQVKGATDTDVTFTAGDISKVNVSSDTKMKIYITDVKWNAVDDTAGLLLSSSTSVDDILAITSGFLRDADEVISTASSSAAFTDTSYTLALAVDTVVSDIYAATVNLSGSGNFEGTKLKSSGVAVTAAGDGDLMLERMVSLGTLESTKTSGSLTVQAWDVADEATVVADANIINTGGDQIQVWFDTSNLGDTSITSLTLIGHNYDLWYDHLSDVGLNFVHEGTEVNALNYLGDFSSDGLLEIIGFESSSDIINLDSGIFSALTGAGSPVNLDANNFVSRPDDHAAQDADDFVIYQEDTGGVYYDADADGSGSSAVLLFTLTDMPTLANTDFKVI